MHSIQDTTLRQCDTGEIKCFICTGREHCMKYPYELSEQGRKEYSITLDSLGEPSGMNLFDLINEEEQT